MIPPESIGFPPEERMAESQGLVENHEYNDLRRIDRLDFDQWLEDERTLLDHPPLDDEYCPDNGNVVYDLGIDPGVASTVAALSTIGACPVSSCSGQEGHYETHPLVLFWCNKRQLTLVQEAAQDLNVTLEGVGTPGILVYAEDVEDMIGFARALIRVWDEAQWKR